VTSNSSRFGAIGIHTLVLQCKKFNLRRPRVHKNRIDVGLARCAAVSEECRLVIPLGDLSGKFKRLAVVECLSMRIFPSASLRE
jgi:hypothetical protein